MGQQRVRDAQSNFAGGVNAIASIVSIGKNQVQLANNARMTEYGALVKRGGTRRLTSSVLHASGVQSGFCWRKDDGTAEIMAVANGTLYTIPVTAIPMTATAQAGTLASSGAPTFAQFRAGTPDDVVYIADGGALNKWDGTTLTTNIPSTPSTTFVCVHNERLWATGDSTAPQGVYYSALNDGDTLGDAGSGGGIINVRTFGDEVVVGLASINTSLLVFHRRGISRITGYGAADTEADPAGVTADVGTIAPESIVAFDNIAYFVSDRGLYRANEAAVAPVGTPEVPDPLITRLRSMTSTQIANIRSEFNRATRELWIYLPGYGVLVYHTVLQAWCGPFTGTYASGTVNTLFWGLDSNGLPQLYFGKSDGYVQVADSATTDDITAGGTAGSAVSMQVNLRRFYVDDPALIKSWRWLYLTGQFTTDTTVSWQSNNDFPPSGGPVNLELSTSSSTQRVPIDGYGQFLQVTIADAGTTSIAVTIQAVAADGFMLGWR